MFLFYVLMFLLEYKNHVFKLVLIPKSMFLQLCSDAIYRREGAVNVIRYNNGAEAGDSETVTPKSQVKWAQWVC